MSQESAHHYQKKQGQSNKQKPEPVPSPTPNHIPNHKHSPANVGSAAAVAAAVLATATGASAAFPQPEEEEWGEGERGASTSHSQLGNSIPASGSTTRSAQQSGEESNPTSTQHPQRQRPSGSISTRAGALLDVPLPNYYHHNSNSASGSSSPNNTSQRVSPVVLTPQTPSPISSISKELKELRKRSLSEISLILEIIKGVAGGHTPRQSGRRFRTASPSLPRPSTSSHQSGLELERRSSLMLNPNRERVSLSTGDLEGANRASGSGDQFLSIPGTSSNRDDKSPSPALTRISSFIRQNRDRAGRIRWERLSPQHIQRQMNIVQEEKAMQLAPTGPIDATRFVAYVQERRKKRILFKGEYLMVIRSIDPQKCTTEVGIRMGDKNTYNDTLPYDYNRVILESRTGFEETHGISDYINASYVQSWLHEKAYVVTQAVKTKQASNDFWRCIWELRANAIVMLTKVFDFMRVMCLQYWPQTKFQFGEIEVETLETKTYAHFVIRTFRLKRLAGGDSAELEEIRIIKHFHFTEWELNSFPYISAFIELRRRVRQWTDKNPDGLDGPTVVHCRLDFIHNSKE